MQYRSDLFNEDKFVSLLEKYDVKNILLYDGNLANPFLMPKLSKNNINIYYLRGNWPQLQLDKNFVMDDKIKNISFASYMYPIDESKGAQNFISNNLNDWEIVYSYEKKTIIPFTPANQPIFHSSWRTSRYGRSYDASSWSLCNSGTGSKREHTNR